MIADYSRGGLKAPDINIILENQTIAWVQRFLFSPDHPWKQIFRWQCEPVGGVKILENISLASNEIKKFNILPFYKNMLISWGNWVRKEIDSENFLQHHLLFNDKIISDDGKCFTDKRLSTKGICKIADLIENNNLIDDRRLTLKYSLNGNDIFSV